MKRVSNWEEWCRVHASLEFWQDEIRAVCESHQVPVHRLQETFPGTHAVFFVNEDIVLKLFCPVRYNSYELELRLHKGPLSDRDFCPKICFQGKSPSGYDYLGFTRLRGQPIRELRSATVPNETIVELAQALATLQTKTLDHRSGGGAPCCLVHYDLTQDHVYLDRRSRLGGIIDWGDARIAHPSEELPVLFINCFQCDDTLIRLFREEYDSSCGHYQIRERDLVDPIKSHPFKSDIIDDLSQKKTAFCERMIKMLSDSHRG